MYFYEHTNGQIIQKPDVVADGPGSGPHEYFQGPMVRRWWHEDDEPED